MLRRTFSSNQLGTVVIRPRTLPQKGDATYYEDGFAMGTEFTMYPRESRPYACRRITRCATCIHVCSCICCRLHIWHTLTKQVQHSQSTHSPPGRMRLFMGSKTHSSLMIRTMHHLQHLNVLSRHSKNSKGQRRKIAILGDMMELGNYSIQAHEHAGEHRSYIGESPYDYRRERSWICKRCTETV